MGLGLYHIKMMWNGGRIMTKKQKKDAIAHYHFFCIVSGAYAV